MTTYAAPTYPYPYRSYTVAADDPVPRVPGRPDRQKILVTGSRAWSDVVLLTGTLMRWWRENGYHMDALLIHGACPYGGADEIAAIFWESLFMETLAVPAETGPNGRLLGPERNAKMVGLAPDICLAFPLPGSRGTWNTVRLARAAGVPVIVTKPEKGTT